MYNQELVNKDIKIYLSGLLRDEFAQKYNNQNICDPVPVFKDTTFGKYEELSLGHYFPPERTSDSFMKKYADSIGSNKPKYMFYSKLIYNEIVTTGSIAFRLIISLEGYETKRRYDLNLSRQGKASKEGTHTDGQRYGIWACKGGVPVEKVDDWIEGGRGVGTYTYMQAFIDCDDFQLTANRGSIMNTDIEKLDMIKAEVNKIFKSKIVKNAMQERLDWEELEKIEKSLEDDREDLQKRFKAGKSRKVIRFADGTEVLEPTISVRDGGIIKEGYSKEADELRDAKIKGKEWLSELEIREKERTGIKTLKVKYNKVFGYYLEVTNSFKDKVPPEWVRKQTLTNAERYTTDELKHLEDVILGAEDKLYSLEYDLFSEVRERIASQVVRIQGTAKAVAMIDAYASLSVVATQNNYVRPKINDKGVIDIKNGRHPVVEKMISNDMFIANDTYLDNNSNRVAIITGPNMAGKSTYMRQSALLTLMTQVGSFIPAREASISPVDKIFTRIGASDDLVSGQSTFMVEMNEVSHILKYATNKSLVILDEIGRGTSTYDGMSIARAVIEHIRDHIGAKTLFATHYHELTDLEDDVHVKNYCIAVKEKGSDVTFLRRIIRGSADKSYGIHVAKLAGLPQEVVKRAETILIDLENTAPTKEKTIISKEYFVSKSTIVGMIFSRC